MLSENDEDIYNEWRRLEDTYDEIDVTSANYFIRGNQVRTMAESALQELKQLSIDNSSTPMSSVYRNILLDICTTYEETFDKGNISEKEKYQIKSWIETDYKLSDEELEVAKEYIDKYFKENKQANQLLNSKTATAAAAIRNQMSVEEFKEYQMMAALYNKTSKWNGFWLGVIDAIPFLTEVIDWSDSMVCEMEEKQTVKNATLSSIMENVRCQNPVAYGSGYAASLAAQTAAIKGLFESGEGAEIAKSAEGLERAETAETAETVKGLEVESGSNFKGQLYNGTRNPDVDFVNGKGKSTLNKHAGKHGYTSPEEYLKDARNFLEKKPTSTIQSFVSNEGTYFRYDTATNEFGIINEYGGISTYFKPENGMAYWLEQIEKYAPK